MNLLLIGSGGREHAIAWKLAQSSKVNKIYCAPGNGGTALENKCENVNLNSINEYLNFALENNIDLTVVGPEAPLVEGVVDTFKEKGLKIFGPSSKGAQLEGSKQFSKDFMKRHGIKTAAYEVFEEYDKALEYIKSCDYPVVIKADGLAAGKGVIICKNFYEAESSLKEFMIDDIFKGSGKKVVVEEFLEGVEASILSVCDGEIIAPFISSKDHKQIFDDNKGPNTGGMGVIAPNPYVTEEVLKDFNTNILEPTLKGIKEELSDYIGIIFFGVMITNKGCYLLEYNVRMGDPETQAVLPLLKTDLVEIINLSLDKKLREINIEWSNEKACCVIAASKGYPVKYETGFEIKIQEEKPSSKVYVSGAKLDNGKLLTTGGRVLSVVAKGEDLEVAIKGAYEALNEISFSGMYYRKDIGKL